jgi:hypothetical protein
MHRESNDPAVTFWPELLTEEELASFLRLHDVSGKAKAENVIANLRRKRRLPYLSISNRLVYPLKLVRQWICEQARKDEETVADETDLGL